MHLYALIIAILSATLAGIVSYERVLESGGLYGRYIGPLSPNPITVLE